MGLNNIEILRQNGGVPATLPGEDHYSGLLVYLDDTDMPVADAGVDGFSVTNRIIQISTIEYAERLGIKADSSVWILRSLHYHLSEAFRINPAIMLWVGLFKEELSGSSFSGIKDMQNFAEGRIRQVVVYAPNRVLAAGDLTLLQGIATGLEATDMPLSIGYVPKIGNISGLTSMATIGLRNVSVIIGQSGSGVAKELFAAGGGKCVGLAGNFIGMLSKVSVHESIAWVAKCPVGVDVPAFSDGTLVKSVDSGVVSGLNDKRFIFLRTYGGLQGSFYNDSFTMDIGTSDYNAIERVRTMDKVCRGVRTYLLPHLSSPLYVDSVSGKLSADTVTYLEQVAGRQLEDMERARELSGYKVVINPDQNVLSSSKLEIVVKQVPVGVMRRVSVKISFTTKLG